MAHLARHAPQGIISSGSEALILSPPWPLRSKQKKRDTRVIKERKKKCTRTWYSYQSQGILRVLASFVERKIIFRFFFGQFLSRDFLALVFFF